MAQLQITPIRSEKDLNKAFARIDQLIEAKPDTVEYEELVILGDLVYAYEQKHHAIGLPDPIDLLKAKIEDGDISLEELKEILPNRSTRSLVLSKQRRIPVKAMYEMVSRGWFPAASVFLPAYFEGFEAAS
ncbi:HTH-type transcriptional regulator/antitoxin HigA [Catalinimonas alkaloidigena]|uniref:helix-turn-helix domain-containing protein n=1 Tax=Catalinimonas alkaloidigena TaxID=1075417 RepID=UPI0024069B3F|nr:hypothetical protein [Catalinimonas alkaloidigena]MDF9797241.1 HTH-type transcriptional regulator/antitoxin HigA [Catalinimonas alkaloidigena]